MLLVLRTLCALGVVFLAVGITLGFTLDSIESVGRHFLIGLGITIFIVLIHCLVLFYLIGTGMDIREAVEEWPEIRSKYVEFTRRQKLRAFPVACFAVVFMILAALMGGEVHSRLIAAATGDALPLRGVPFWWIHLACVVLAVASSLHAFRVELDVVRENRRAIEEINAYLGARDDPGGSASERAHGRADGTLPAGSAEA